jgi:hypothetical protein
VRITESQLRRIIREEILGESIYSDRSFHAGSRPYRHEYFEAKDWEDVTRAFENVVGRTGNRRIMLTDLFKEMERMNPRDYPDLVERYLETGARAEDFLIPGFFNGTGLMLRDGAVQEVIEPIGEAKTQKKSYGKKEYKSSSGSVAAIKKHGGSAKKAVAAGAFNWASDPWAAANAAHIVAMGEPTVRKGVKRKK